MDDKIFELSHAIRWSRDKFDAFIIFDRINKKTFLIETTTGKEIWEGILRKDTLKQMVEGIKQKFRTGKPSEEIEHDAMDFINDLANANIIHILKKTPL